MEQLLIESVDTQRREAVLAELLKQMAFRGVNVLVVRAESFARVAELEGQSEFLNQARDQWSDLLKLAEEASAISRENDVGDHGVTSGRAGRPSWWVRASNWLRSRWPSGTDKKQPSVTLRSIEETWAASCERLTGFAMSPPSFRAIGEWHRQMCSTETADNYATTCHEATNHRFDVVILLGGERVSDETIAQLATKAVRLIVFGTLPAIHASDISAGGGRDAAENTAGFGRLWRSMQHSPFGAQYRWVEQAGHISCRLDDYPYDSTYVERERVADRPEIELRIDAPPHGSPRLVEIVFPRGQGIEEGKKFAYRELEHLAIDATGKRLHWNDTAEHITVQLSPVSSQRHCFIEIASGVRERVCFVNCDPAQANAGRWITERLEFDRDQGWDRAGAEDWLKSQCGFWNDERALTLEPVLEQTEGTPVSPHLAATRG
jgi:hypothetical protein